MVLPTGILRSPDPIANSTFMLPPSQGSEPVEDKAEEENFVNDEEEEEGDDDDDEDDEFY